jgi:hypothetical protein
MPWREPQTLALTRIGVISQVPSESGVYAIFDGDTCLLVGEAWNMKARLLELMNILQEMGEFQVTFELCPEDTRVARKEEVAATLLQTARCMEVPVRDLPGISFWNSAR